MRKIDIHCHTSNRIITDVVPASATLEAIAEETIKYDVEKTVVLATYFPHKSSGISNFRLLDWIRNSPHQNKFLMFGSLDFEHYFFQGYNELEELAQRGQISGIKIYTNYQQIEPRGEKMEKIAELASEFHLPLMFHGGESYSAYSKYGKLYLANLVLPGELEYLAKEYRLDVIISHLCTPFVQELVEAVKRNEKMYSDMSGLIGSKHGEKYIPESIEHIKRFLGECGPEKLLFGTDFPVQTHEHSIFMLEEAMKDYSVEDKQKVYYENARGVLPCQL
ncbi:MAG: amidohydrolase family protein [Nanoarchaeota archaeon]